MTHCFIKRGIKGCQTLHECCIKFKNKFRVTGTNGDAYYTQCALCRNIASDVYNEANYVVDDQNKMVSGGGTAGKLLPGDG